MATKSVSSSSGRHYRLRKYQQRLFPARQPYGDLIKITAAPIWISAAPSKAAEHGLGKAYSVRDLLADPEIDMVLNLTIPAAHAAVNQQALRAGKHVYAEKPFSLNYKEGLKTVKEAQKRKLRVGCAPTRCWAEASRPAAN